MNRRSFWAIGLDNNSYRGDGVGAWAYVGRDAQDLAASSDGGVVTVNRNTKAIWRKFGDNTVEAWNLMPNATANAALLPTPSGSLALGWTVRSTATDARTYGAHIFECVVSDEIARPAGTHPASLARSCG